MKDQILKLCRRLKQCTLSDITQFTELSEEEVTPIIYYLIDNNYIKNSNGIFAPKQMQEQQSKKNFSLMIQFHSEEDLETILKGFCLEISPVKIGYFVKCNYKCVCDFYKVFREKIYESQHKDLINNYFKKPQITRYRKFFEKYAYFYSYNDNIYVSDKPLRANYEKEFTKTEVQEFKKVYSFLTRVESHNINENYMYHRLAEGIWRRNKSFEQLYSELKFLLNT